MSTTNSVSNSNIPAAGLSNTPANMQISQADFLQLITAQMKDQNPLSPADPTQFVSQLEGMSQVSAMQSMQSTMQASAIMSGTNLHRAVDPGTRHPGNAGDGRRDRRCRRSPPGHDQADCFGCGLDRGDRQYVPRHTGCLRPDLFSLEGKHEHRRHRRCRSVHDRRDRHRRRQDPGTRSDGGQQGGQRARRPSHERGGC